MPSLRKQEDYDALKIFGKTIKNLRIKAGISQEKLGILVGLHRTTIGELERGEQNVSLLSLRYLSSALEVPIPELIDGIEPAEISAEDIKNNLANAVDGIMEESNMKFVYFKKPKTFSKKPVKLSPKEAAKARKKAEMEANAKVAGKKIG